MAKAKLPDPLPDAVAELIARRFAVLAEPMRLKVLNHLRACEEAAVLEIADTLGATHANVSRHLGVLHDAGIVARRKEGTRALYRIVDVGVFRLCEDVCDGLAEHHRELGALFELNAGTAAA